MFLAGILLLAAALLKWRGVYLVEPGTALGGEGRFSWLLLTGIIAEAAVGLWLISGVGERTGRSVGAAVFMAFAGVNLAHLFIDTRPLSVDDFGRPTFRMSVPFAAWFKTDSDSGTRNWKLAGVVRQAILTSATELRIPERFVAQHANQSVGVLAVSTMEALGVERIKATTSKKWLRAEMERVDGKRWRLHLATTDAAPEGAVEAAVYLHAETAKDDPIPPLRIDVKGQLRTWLRTLPREVDMGVVYAGEDRSVDLQLTTVQSAPFAIQKIEAPKRWQVEMITDHPSKKVFRIRCTAAVGGNVAVEDTLEVVATVVTPSGRKVVSRVSVPMTALLVGKKE